MFVWLQVMSVGWNKDMIKKDPNAAVTSKRLDSLLVSLSKNVECHKRMGGVRAISCHGIQCRSLIDLSLQPMAGPVELQATKFNLKSKQGNDDNMKI